MSTYVAKLIKSETMWALLGLTLAVALLLSPVFFQGKVLVPGDLPNSDPFFINAGNPPPPQPKNSLLGDQIVQFHVWHRLAAASLAADGNIPLWNPYIFTGQPLVANAQSALFYPPNLLLRFISAGKVASIRAIFNLLFAGLFTWLFLRTLKVSPAGAFVAAISFILSGPVIAWLGHPHANVLVCLPFMLWAGENLLRKPNCFWAVLLAAGLGVSILGGHPETHFHVWFIFAAYFLARLALVDQELRQKGKILLALFGASLLGTLIGGIQLVPFLDFMLQSSTFAQRSHSSAGMELYEPSWLANFSTIATFICPNFFGNPIDDNYIWPFSVFQNYSEQAVYFGTIPFALAVSAMFARNMRRPFVIMACLALLCIGVAWRLPLMEAVNHLPIFKMALNKRLKFPFAFFAACMAGYGFDIMLEHLRAAARQSRSFLVCAAVVFGTLFFYLLIMVWKLTLAAQVQVGTFNYELLHVVFAGSQWKTYLPFLTAVVAGSGYFLYRRHKIGSTCIQVGLIAVIMIELIALGWGYNPAVKEADILPRLNAVDFMQQRENQPFRVLTTNEMFWPNYSTVYGIGDVAGYDLPVYRRYSDLYLALGGEEDFLQGWNPDWSIIDFLNVKYLISQYKLPEERFKPVFASGSYLIYENMHVYPRAFMVYDSEVIANDKPALAEMVKAGRDFSKKVILEEPLQPRLTGDYSAMTFNSVDISSYSTDKVVLQVTTQKPGVLVMSDLYTPDWVARLDSQVVKLYRADYTYRAVYVPAGDHTVSFEYSPVSYRIGATMTIAALVVLLLLGLKALWPYSSLGRGQTS